MVDIPLIVNADTSSVVKGKADLAGFKEALGGVKTETDAVTGASQRGTGAAKTYTDSQRQGSRASEEAARAAREQASAVDRLSQAYKVAKIAIAGVVGAAIVRDLQNTTMSLQKINMTFTAVTGSAAEAAAEMDYVRATADRLGQDVLTAAGAYAKLLAATKGTNITLQESRTVFEGITAAATAYGLSQYELEGALMAVQQMISKGSVQAEELRGQLGERLPGAFQIAARSMNMSTQELSKALELGQVAADDFVRAFGAQLQAEFGAFATQTYTTATAINELENAMLALKEVVIASGFQDAFFTVLAGLNQLAQSDGAVALAEALGAAFKVAAEAARVLIEILTALANNGAVVSIIKVVTSALGILAENIEVVIVAAGTLGSVMVAGVLAQGFTAIAPMIGIMVGALGTAITSTGLLATALTVLTGPIGIAIAAVGVLTAGYFLLNEGTVSLAEASQKAQTALMDVQASMAELDGLQLKQVENYEALGRAIGANQEAQETASAIAIASTDREIEAKKRQIEIEAALLATKIALQEQAIKDSEAALLEAARADERARLQGMAKNRGDIARIPGQVAGMDDTALLEGLHERLLLEAQINGEIDDREMAQLEEFQRLMEAKGAIESLKEAQTGLQKAVAASGAETQKLVAEAKALGSVKAAIEPTLRAIQSYSSILGLAADDASALQAALKEAFDAKTPAAMASAIGKVREIIDKSAVNTDALDAKLQEAQGTMSSIAGMNISQGIWNAVGAAAALVGKLREAAGAQSFGVGRGGAGPGGPLIGSGELAELQAGGGKILNMPAAGSSGGGGGGGGGATVDAYKEQQLDLTKRLAEAERERAAVLGGEDMERYAAVQQAINAATAEGTVLTEEQIDAITGQANAVFDLEENVKSLKDAFDAIEAAAESFGSAIGKALGDAVFGVGNFRDAAREAFKSLVTSILEELGKLAANKILMMILGGAMGGGGGGGLFGGMFGGGGGGFSFGLANGGVIEAPTFAMTSRGRLGQVAENGPEAVLPLSRGPDGKLGVQNAGGGGGVTVNITNNAPVEVATSQRDDGGIDIVISAAARATADGVARGTGDLARVLESTYGLRRQGR